MKRFSATKGDYCVSNSIIYYFIFAKNSRMRTLRYVCGKM